MIRLVKIYQTNEFKKWFNEQTYKSQIQMYERLERIEYHTHFGDHKYLYEQLWELKWQNGRRIYYATLLETEIIILLGGNKNGQEKDIRAAKRILKKYT